MSLRVLHVLDHSVPLHSGYAFRTLAILREQRRRGMEPILITSPKHYGATCDEETVDGFHFYRTRPTPSLTRRLPVLNQWMIVIDTARRMRQILASVRPDIIHAHSPALNGMAAVRVARQARLPVVYEMRASWEDAAVDHGTTRAGSLRYRLSRHVETRVLRDADAITTICEGLRADIAIRGISPERITVIPNAVDIEDFPVIGTADETLRAQLGLGSGPVLGFVGSFYGYEGLDLLLAAVPAIARRHSDLKVLLVGGGPEEARLRELTEQLGIASVTRFAGRVPHRDVPRYYSLIDLLVYARKSTRLTEMVTPLKPLEAMAQGRMYLASNVGGHRELVPAALRDCLFVADDVAGLAASALAMLDRRAEWPTLAAHGRAFVESQRTWAASVARYDAVYSAAQARAH
jgi:PEP-CTERM/exosortase A-associated glycosyltransferase